MTSLLSIAGHLADALAHAAQLAYRTGRAYGRVWFSYGLPALLAAADGASWLLAQIDWAEVAATVRAGLAVLVAATVTGAQLAIPALCAASERLGKAYAAVVVGGTATPAPAIEAAPVAVTTTTAAPAAPIKARKAHSSTKAPTVAELRKQARAAGHSRAWVRVARRAELLEVLAA